MFKIQNKNFFIKKNIYYTLKQITGMNILLIHKFVSRMGCTPFSDIRKFNYENTQFSKLREFFYTEEDYFEDTLLKKESISINFLKELHNYKGYRHIFKYPVRGQRTHTNAQTTKKARKYI